MLLGTLKLKVAGSVINRTQRSRMPAYRPWFSKQFENWTATI